MFWCALCFLKIQFSLLYTCKSDGVAIDFNIWGVVVVWGFDEVMFLSCFSVKISESSETLKTEVLHKELCN